MIIEKDCNKEDCDDWKRLWWLKKIVIIEKDCDTWNDCDNWKILWWLKKRLW